MAINLSDKLVKSARKFSKIEHRSLAKQVEHWAMLGKCMEENPDLNAKMIKEILMSIEEIESGEGSEYQFD